MWKLKKERIKKFINAICPMLLWDKNAKIEDNKI